MWGALGPFVVALLLLLRSSFCLFAFFFLVVVFRSVGVLSSIRGRLCTWLLLALVLLLERVFKEDEYECECSLLDSRLFVLVLFVARGKADVALSVV